MNLRKIGLGAVVLVAASVPGVVSMDGAVAATHANHAVVVADHACTRTSSGKCIRGGEFCPKAKYNKSGWDAKGRRYVCKGSRSHPHWEKP